MNNRSGAVRQVRMSDVASKIGSGATPRGGKAAYKPSGIALIRSLNVYDFHFDPTDLAFIDDEQASKLSNVSVERGDILLNITGASVARCCMVPEDRLPARVNQHVAIIRPRQEVANARYVLYTINSPVCKSQLLSLAQGGATREALTKTTIEEFRLPLPPLPTQRRIASILSAYDDLIENNTRRIAILEEMAQAIYREWFVHFRFPGHEGVEMVDSELGKIPEGWEISKVGALVDRLPAGKTYKQTEVQDNGVVPVVDQSSAEVLGYHNDEPGHVASSAEPLIAFGDHTCKMQLMISPFSLGPNVIPFRSVRGDLPVPYLYFVLHSLVRTREYKRHWTALVNRRVVINSGAVAVQFADLVTVQMQLIELLKAVRATLRQARDLLLPKLISGEIDVSEFSDELEEAIA